MKKFEDSQEYKDLIKREEDYLISEKNKKRGFRVLPDGVGVNVSEFNPACGIVIPFGSSFADKYFNPEEGKTATVKATLDYPLTTPHTFELKCPEDQDCFSLLGVIYDIVEEYKKIYDEENKTSTIKEDCIEGSFNRVTTNGTYGIWGHFLEDLWIEDIRLNPGTNSIDITMGS